MHSLWRFRPPLIQEQADRRSTWVLGCCIPPSSLANVVTLQTFILEIPTTLDNILASCWRFKGGVVRVAHERGATYAKVQRRPGSRTGFKHYAIASGFRMAVPGCTKSNFDLGERGKRPYSVCLLEGGVSFSDFLIALLAQTFRHRNLLRTYRPFQESDSICKFMDSLWGLGLQVPSNYYFFPVSEYCFLLSRETKSLLQELRDLRTHLSSTLLYIHLSIELLMWTL